MAIKAVFEWFMQKLENEYPDCAAYQITFPSLPYVLEMRREYKESEENDIR